MSRAMHETREGGDVSEELIDQQPAERPSRLGNAAILSLLILLIALPLVFYAVPHEVANWRMARALDARLSGNLSESQRWADRAIATGPPSAQLLAYRSAIRREAGDLSGSLEDAEQVVGLAPDQPVGYLQRGLALQQSGRWRKAVGDWQKLLGIADDRLNYDQSEAAQLEYANALNGLAYARALAGVDLEEGLEDVEQAIRIAGDLVAFLDTRGYLHYRLGHLQEARRDLELVVDQTQSELERQAWKLRRQLQATVDQRRLRQALNELEELQAVLLHHRGLVYEALGMTNAAHRDLDRAEQLGFNPAAGVF